VKHDVGHSVGKRDSDKRQKRPRREAKKT